MPEQSVASRHSVCRRRSQGVPWCTARGSTPMPGHDVSLVVAAIRRGIRRRVGVDALPDTVLLDCALVLARPRRRPGIGKLSTLALVRRRKKWQNQRARFPVPFDAKSTPPSISPARCPEPP